MKKIIFLVLLLVVAGAVVTTAGKEKKKTPPAEKPAQTASTTQNSGGSVSIGDIAVKKVPGGCELSNKKTGEKEFITSVFSSGFESPTLQGLFSLNSWKLVTLQSPKANTVPEYVALNKKIMEGGDFLDNRIDVESKNVHSGSYALKFYAVTPKTGEVSKALVEKNNLCFVNGDDIWFSGWYYVMQGMPSTLVDFETRAVELGPGIRLFIRNGKYASIESKFDDKPQFNQKSVEFPRNKWVHIKLHIGLSEKADGVVEMWQDGKKIISTTGRTLPTRDTVYNSMEVGITATPEESTILADDIAVSDQPL